MPWVDSHCHLDFPEFPYAGDLLSQLSQAGCAHVLVPGTQAKYFQRQQALQQLAPEMVLLAFGLHPYFLDESSTDQLPQLEQVLSQTNPVAVGEIGLDYVLPEASHQLQMTVFQAQVSMAKDHDLPLVLHCRKAHDQLWSELRKQGFDHGGFVHGFSGSYQQAKRYLDLGLCVGIGGAVTYDRANALKSLVKKLPNDGYVLETDSPDMPPAFARGQANTPLNIPAITEFIAKERDQSVEEIYEYTTNNVKRILGL